MKWVTLDWTKKFLLLKIPTDPRYCKRLSSISKRERKREGRERDRERETEREREGYPVHSWASIKHTIHNISKTNLNV